MAVDPFGVIRAADAARVAVEGERDKVSKLKTDHNYLNYNTPRLSLIISAVQGKINNGVANQLEQQWLKPAEDLERELISILGKLDRVLKVSGEWWTLPYIWRPIKRWWSTNGPNNLGRKTSEKRQQLEDRLTQPCAQEIEKSLFNIPLAQTRPVIRLLGGQHTVSFTKKNSDQFWTQFQEANVQVIGIHGMIGIGKSTFLKQVNDQFCDDPRGYDMVIFVPQSSNSNVEEEVRRIQDEIATRLGLSLPGKSEIRGTTLRSTLSRMNVLILLDNLLHGVTLASLGIPIPAPDPAPALAKAPHALPTMDLTVAPENQSKICKVVFTARRKFTGSNIGAPVHAIELDLLDTGEARKLFKFKARQHHPNPLTSLTESMEKQAHKIVDICDRLPLALDKIGGNLQNKSRCEEWRTEIERLGKPERASGGDPEGQVYAYLKEAYDSLKDSRPRDSYSEKDCFLHCSLFPAGHSIEENELKCHWMVEELLGEVSEKNELHVHFDRAVTIIEELKRAHLLSSSIDNQYSVKLHSQFHCMARWIEGSNNTGKIFWHSDGNHNDLSKMTEECRKKVKWITSMNCVENLGNIDCPNLSTLVIRDSGVTKLKPDLFASIQKSLKVLDLATCTLPVFQLNDVNMSELQYLNLSHAKITSFPFDAEVLSKLKFLDLSFTENLTGLSPNILSVFDGLQSLNLYYCGPCGSAQQGQENSTFLLLKEVEKLKFLVDVAVTIRGNPAFQKLKDFSKLDLAHSMVITNCSGTKNQLTLKLIATARKLRVLHVIHCSATLHLPRDAINPKNCFEDLCNVEIKDCWNLKDLTWLKYARTLQLLKIVKCSNLTAVIDLGGEKEDACIFDKLRNLELIDLNKLSSILFQDQLPELIGRPPRDLDFSSLESIKVSNCGRLGPIPIADNRGRRMRPVIKCQKMWWKGIKDNEKKSRLIPEFIL